MNQQTEQARELLAQQRHQEDLRHEAMRSRSEAELHQPDSSSLDAQARAAMAHERADVDQTQESMLERSEQELQ